MAQKTSAKKHAGKTIVKKASGSPKSAKKVEATKAKATPAPVGKKVAAVPLVATKKVTGKASAPAAAVAVKEVKKEKVQSLSKSDLQYYRGLLLERRREILGDMGSMESEAFKGGGGGSNLSNMPIHMADVGTDNFEQEFTLGLIESERKTLREIQEALIRVDDGTYGICQGTGKLIPKSRLEAVPWAKFTIEYQGLIDQGKVARDEEASEEESGGGGGDDDED